MKEQEKQPVTEAAADDGPKGSAGNKFSGKLFSSFDLPDDVLSSLEAMGISNCTPIQEKVIEPILGGGDIIGKAETGTGKTIGFGAPLVAKIDTQRVADRTWSIFRALGLSVFTSTRRLLPPAIAKGRERCFG